MASSGFFFCVFLFLLRVFLFFVFCFFCLLGSLWLFVVVLNQILQENISYDYWKNINLMKYSNKHRRKTHTSSNVCDFL